MERLHEEVRGLERLPDAVVQEIEASGDSPDASLLAALRRIGAQPPNPSSSNVS
jgi:putative GTP pyrophosphokinase